MSDIDPTAVPRDTVTPSHPLAVAYLTADALIERRVREQVAEEIAVQAQHAINYSAEHAYLDAARIARGGAR